MRKTILQALLDEIHFPISEGHVENRLLKRGLYPCDECTIDVLNSKEFIGATADCLWWLVSAPSFSEADKAISGLNIDSVLRQSNFLYKSIGEPEKTLMDSPMVSIEN